MSTEYFISRGVLCIPCMFIDELCDEYDLDFDEEDVVELLNHCAGDYFHESRYRNVGNMLVEKLFKDIIEKYTDVLDEEKFDYYINGDDSDLFYDGVQIFSKAQLDEISDRVEDEILVPE